MESLTVKRTIASELYARAIAGITSASIWFLFGFILSTSGCVDVKGPTSPIVDRSNIFASLDFTTKAAFIKKSDTLSLTLLATAIDGSSIPIVSDSISWTSSDSSLVHVDTLGRIVGRGITQLPVEVVARYTHAFTTRTDTIDVYVTQDEFQATSIKITAVDSTRVGADAKDQSPRIRIDLLNKDTVFQTPVSMPIDIPSSFFLTYRHTGGPNNEPVYQVSSSGTYFGKFWIKASFNLYGTEVRDSVEFIGLHRYKLVTVGANEQTDGSFVGPDAKTKVSVQSCGTFAIALVIQRPVDVVFNDSLATSDACNPLSPSALLSMGLIKPFFKEDVIGGNILNIQPGVSIYTRRSNTKGEITWYLRDAVTKQRLPVGGRFQIIDVE